MTRTSRSLPLAAGLLFAAAMPALSETITGDAHFGCSKREIHDKLNEYAAQNDPVAFNKVLTAGYASGICIKFKKGAEVIVIDRSWSGDMVIRFPGQLEEYWTAVEAIE